MKSNIGASLARLGRVTSFPHRPQQLMCWPRIQTASSLSNGPGDPVDVAVRHRGDPGHDRAGADLRYLSRAPAARQRDRWPALSSCHSVTTAVTHPVKNLLTERVEITSQNHNFAVDPDSLSGRAEMTHVNLNDGVCEGLQVNG